MAMKRFLVWSGLGMWLVAGRAGAANPAEWTTPIAPFRIADNLYYVGSKDLASYLVVTCLLYTSNRLCGARLI